MRSTPTNRVRTTWQAAAETHLDLRGAWPSTKANSCLPEPRQTNRNSRAMVQVKDDLGPHSDALGFTI